MRSKEEWKQPVSGPDAWKAISVTVVLLSGMLAFMQMPNHLRFERLGSVVALLIIWTVAAFRIFKFGWRVLWSSQGLLLSSYTLFIGGTVLPHGAVTLWLTDIGVLLVMGALGDAIFDFSKSRKPISTDIADATK